MSEGGEIEGNSHREGERARAAEGEDQIAEGDPSATRGISSLRSWMSREILESENKVLVICVSKAK